MPSTTEEPSLADYIKYCLGYIQQTRPPDVEESIKAAARLPREHFSLLGLLNGDTDGSPGELVDLPLFYGLDPAAVPEDKRASHALEKALASRLEDIHAGQKNDQYTKSVHLHFGFCDLEASWQEEGEPSARVRRLRRALFTLPVRVEKTVSEGTGRYWIFPADPEVRVNLQAFEPILGESLQGQILEAVSLRGASGRLSLPITEAEVFTELWQEIEARLRLKDARFGEGSFALEEMALALSPRGDYFLTLDLEELAKVAEEGFSETALSCWTQEEDLGSERELPAEKNIHFPFRHDKYQLRVLTLGGHRAAIVQGPPGTGKSETIANLLCHLAATGRRALFVSQKAQALRVVKDKLKRLDMPYLFGYVPNPRSSELAAEDEADGVAPRLAALDSYLESLAHRPREDGAPGDDAIAEAVRRKTALREAFNEAVAAQRTFHSLSKDLEILSAYSVELADAGLFEKNYTCALRSRVLQQKSEADRLAAAAADYSVSEKKRAWDGRLSPLSLDGRSHAEDLLTLRLDVEKTGYDRHNPLGRALNNAWRRLRLSALRSRLPRELLDAVDAALSGDLSRSGAAAVLKELEVHCRHYELLKQLKETREALAASLASSGLSAEQFDSLERLLPLAGGDPEKLRANLLRARELRKALARLKEGGDPNALASALKEAEEERSRAVSRRLRQSVDGNLLSRWREAQTRRVVKKVAVAFGRSRRAYKTFDKLRRDPGAFKAILEILPIWIMELDDASRIIPFEPGLFDTVILDEASQCNVAYTLPVLYRAKKALFVGDSEQMRDSTVLFKSNRAFDELARRWRVPEDLRIKASGTSVQSVLDIAALRGLPSVPLRYHYRSPAALIGFSNRHFYKPKGKELVALNHNYVPFCSSDRVLCIHHVEAGGEKDPAVNDAEARAMLAFFRLLRSDARTKDRSVGLLSFFNAQAAHLRKVFEEARLREESDNFRISVIEGIQGEEKDIVLYSFVLRGPEARRQYQPLTGEGGDIQGELNRGRVNVAFSRARLQAHCFLSLPREQVPEGIWIRRYLDYVAEAGVPPAAGGACESELEREFDAWIREALPSGCSVSVQVPSCGFRIDSVIASAATGKRLALELDGPTHFKDESGPGDSVHAASDEERQRVLEAAGWRFHRVRLSDWSDPAFDRGALLQTLLAQLA